MFCRRHVVLSLAKFRPDQIRPVVVMFLDLMSLFFGLLWISGFFSFSSGCCYRLWSGLVVVSGVSMFLVVVVILITLLIVVLVLILCYVFPAVGASQDSCLWSWKLCRDDSSFQTFPPSLKKLRSCFQAVVSCLLSRWVLLWHLEFRGQRGLSPTSPPKSCSILRSVSKPKT